MSWKITLDKLSPKYLFLVNLCTPHIFIIRDRMSRIKPTKEKKVIKNTLLTQFLSDRFSYKIDILKHVHKHTIRLYKLDT